MNLLNSPDSIKAAISGIGAAVSVVSAISSFISARAAKIEAWNVKRDTLVVQIVANQAEEEALSLKAALAREPIETIPPGTLSHSQLVKQGDLLDGLSKMSMIAELISRDYTARTIDELEYSKENVKLVSKCLRGELAQKAILSGGGWGAVLREAERFP